MIANKGGNALTSIPMSLFLSSHFSESQRSPTPITRPSAWLGKGCCKLMAENHINQPVGLSMQSTLLPEETQASHSIQELEALAEKAANAFKPFLGADGFDLNQYKQFLNTMYHYTARSGEMISHAGNIAHDDVLRAYFTHMLNEEKSHYILAREDLRELGDDISEALPESVRNFHAKWFSLGETIYPYLGAVYVFENIAKHLQNEGKFFFERLNLEKKQRRWVAIHLEADLVHGEEIIELCSRYFDDGPLAFFEGGRMMCASWIGVFTGFNTPKLQ